MQNLSIQGISVPVLGLGTWQLTGNDCLKAVAHALSIGYRHVDTAQAYDNEDEVGRSIAGSGIPRDAIFLTTKVWRSNVEPKKVVSSTRESLQKLRTDYVDLLLIHWPVEDVPLEYTLDALVRLKEDGLTRLIGVSNFPPSLYRRALKHAPVACNQVEYHPLLAQEPLFGITGAHDAFLTAYSPLAHGKIADEPVVQSIARTHGKSAFQVALRWLVQQDRVAAIPKASSTAHRSANLNIFDFELSADEMREISALDRGERVINPSWAPRWED